MGSRRKKEEANVIVSHRQMLDLFVQSPRDLDESENYGTATKLTIET